MSDVLSELTARVAAGHALSAAEAAEAARALVPAEVPAATKKAFLGALAARGETADEVAAFAGVFRGLSRPAGLEAWADRGIDVCGTGGSHTGRTNVSTMAGFVVAALGVPVLKHGNRAATSRSGSADFLEAFGLPLQPSEDARRILVDEIGFVFLFAPAFHPAFREIGPVRRELAAEGRRTIFNLLGPLINPARPAHQLLGVFDAAWTSPVASALDRLGLRRGWVVHGLDGGPRGVDELVPAGENVVAGFGEWSGRRERWTGAVAGAGGIADLVGGTAADNLAEFDAIAAGGGRPAVAAAVAENAGAALWIAGAAADLADGRARAVAALRDGTVSAWATRARALFPKLPA